jgi:cyanate lyase
VGNSSRRFWTSSGEKGWTWKHITEEIGGMSPIPTDPLLYRFYELVMVNGPALKALIEEEFGDGIMSAIDFDLKFDRLPHAKGDRVQIVMSGKFLPYKYYGAEQGVPEYGFKEE